METEAACRYNLLLTLLGPTKPSVSRETMETGNRHGWKFIVKAADQTIHQSPVRRYFVFQREKSASRYGHVVFTRSRHALRYAICIVPLRSRSLILALHEQAFQGRLGWFVASIKTVVRIFFFLKFPLLLLLFRACWIYRGYYRCCCYY